MDGNDTQTELTIIVIDENGEINDFFYIYKKGLKKRKRFVFLLLLK